MIGWKQRSTTGWARPPEEAFRRTIHLSRPVASIPFGWWRIRRVTTTLVILAALLAILGVYQSQAADAPVLEVQIDDHREALEDFQALVLTIPALAIHPAGLPRTGGCREIPTQVQQVDLTKHTATNPATILRARPEPGPYDGLRLDIREIHATARDGRSIPVLVASGPVAAAFTAAPGVVTLVRLDLKVIDMSDHPPKGYELHIKSVSVTTGAP